MHEYCDQIYRVNASFDDSGHGIKCREELFHMFHHLFDAVLRADGVAFLGTSIWASVQTKLISKLKKY